MEGVRIITHLRRPILIPSLASDEVSALVVDIGTSSLRAGYAGDDTPKAIIPTTYGYIEELDTPAENGDGDVSMSDAGANAESEAADPRTKVKLYIGANGPSLWRENMKVENPVKNGLSELWLFLRPRPESLRQCNGTPITVQNFDAIPPLISHALEEVMRCNPSEHPVLVTEPAWNTPANRERMAEIMFEHFNVPAFYISNTSVLNA